MTQRCIYNTGIGGLQWKHHLGQKVRVTVNEKDTGAVEDIHANCKMNGVGVLPDSEAEADEDAVEIVEGDANIIMHQRQFSFM